MKTFEVSRDQTIKFLSLLTVVTLLTGCKQQFAEKKVRDNLRGFHAKALTCLSDEGVTRAEVDRFFFHQPHIPSYKHLEKIRDNAERYSQMASRFSDDDKVKHCFMGHLLTQETNRPSAVFMAFYKEAQDVGDCNRRTRFEVADQVATVVGAGYAKRGVPVERCHEINQRLADDLIKWEEMLRRREQKQDR